MSDGELLFWDADLRGTPRTVAAHGNYIHALACDDDRLYR